MASVISFVSVRHVWSRGSVVPGILLSRYASRAWIFGPRISPFTLIVTAGDEWRRSLCLCGEYSGLYCWAEEDVVHNTCEKTASEVVEFNRPFHLHTRAHTQWENTFLTSAKEVMFSDVSGIVEKLLIGFQQKTGWKVGGAGKGRTR